MQHSNMMTTASSSSSSSTSNHDVLSKEMVTKVHERTSNDEDCCGVVVNNGLSIDEGSSASLVSSQTNCLYDEENDEFIVFEGNREPKDLIEYLDRFDNFRSSKDFNSAITCISECIKLYPNYFYLYYKQSFLYKSLKKHNIETIRNCKMALHISMKQRNRFWTHLLSGFLKELRGDFIKALEQYEAAVKFKTRNTLHESDLYFRIAMVKGDLNLFEESKNYFLKAYNVQYESDHTKLYYLGMCYNNIGWCYKQLTDDDNALKYYGMGIDICNGSVVLFYTNKIKALKTLERYDEALEDCEKALKLTTDPKSICEIYCEMAFLYHLKKKKQISVKLFLKALGYNRRIYFPYLYIGAANIHRAESQLNNAEDGEFHPIQILTEGINTCDEGLVDLFQMRQSIFEFLGDADAAQSDKNKLKQLKKGLRERIC